MPAAAVELEAALRKAGVTDLHQDMAALLLAQLAFETGNGTACDNRNVGNITTSDRTSRTFFRPAWFTVTPESSPRLRELNAAMQKGQAPRAFVAYQDFVDGFRDYARELRTQFPTIIAAASTGDAQATAAAIKSSNYTPDAPSSLGATLDSLRRGFLAKGLFSSLPKEQPAPFAPVPASPSFLD
jgi:type II secretory pathway pseudopilin PulG